jgi:predicted phosphodiesterase
VRLALIADVHGNLEALEAVIADIDERSPDARIVCAGDVVGYGPDPEACIDRLRSIGVPCVMGNHDEMVLGRRDFSRCVHSGITAALWTRQNLSPGARAFLDSLPPWLEATPHVVVCHGTLDNADTYVSDTVRAESALRQLEERWPRARMLVCGHTHHAAVYSRERGFSLVRSTTELPLTPGIAHVVNPGAVGQSRDGKPLARYAVFDAERQTIAYRELPYDHQATIRKMRCAGLVPKVIQLRPRGIRRYVESFKRRWSRYWAERGGRARGGRSAPAAQSAEPGDAVRTAAPRARRDS